MHRHREREELEEARNTHLVVLLDLPHPGTNGVAQEVVGSESVDVHVAVGRRFVLDLVGALQSIEEERKRTHRHIETS